MVASFFDHFIQLSKKEPLQILVAGSKPDPVFPTNNLDIFVGVHGGIFHADRFPDTVLKIGIISNWFLFSPETYCDPVRDLIKNTSLDHLIIIESMEKRHEDIPPSALVQLKDMSTTRISRAKCTGLELKYLWPQYIFSLFSALPIRKMMGFCLQLITEKTSYLTRLSTGMFSVLYLHQLLPSNSKLFVAGIGLQPSGPYFFDQSQKMKMGGHYAQDIFIANKLLRSGDSKVINLLFTDPDAIDALAEMDNTSIVHYIKSYLASIQK